jgi:hypothetical protein
MPGDDDGLIPRLSPSSSFITAIIERRRKKLKHNIVDKRNNMKFPGMDESKDGCGLKLFDHHAS